MKIQLYVLLATVILLPAAATYAEDSPTAGPENADFDKDFAPDQSKLPVAAPEGATVLFDGKGVNLFRSMKGDKVNWPSDGELVSTRRGPHTNHIVSLLHFRDADIHVEFNVPPTGSGNSGVYIHGNYELQIINSYGKDKNKVSMHDIGAVYGFSKPRVNAARKPGEWQVYDIRYRAPRRDENGKIVEDGHITAYLNGEVVQKNARFNEPKSVYHPYRHGTTPYLQKIWIQQKKEMVGPFFLQDHGNPVRFRNVWIKPLDDKSKIYEEEKE